MSCTLSQEQIDKAIAFHGHWCPGLALGLRAAEWALTHMGSAQDEDIVTITETDMCAVDAIQALVGCTFGKGNLIYRDYGKVAFSFYRRKDGVSARLIKRTDFTNEDTDAVRRELLRRFRAGETLTEAEKKLHAQMRQEDSTRIMSLPLEKVFHIGEVAAPLPPRARLMKTLICTSCGEGVMESRTRNLNGKIYCIPCFRELDDR